MAFSIARPRSRFHERIMTLKQSIKGLVIDLWNTQSDPCIAYYDGLAFVNFYDKGNAQWKTIRGTENPDLEKALEQLLAKLETTRNMAAEDTPADASEVLMRAE